MSDVVLSTTEYVTTVTTVDDVVSVAVTTNPVTVTTQTAGVQGASYSKGDPIYEYVRNSTGTTLLKGQIVYLSGATGNHVNVRLAQASGDNTSARTIGWVSEDIANNANGYVMMFGYLEGIDTSAANAVGDILYLSPTVAGGWTSTKPSAPDHLVYVGVCVRKNPSNGAVSVHIQNGYELGELHDVAISNPVNNQVLTYDSATDLWKNATNPADGVTSITATAPLTGGTITSTGSIGLDQTALSLTRSQITDFTSGTVTSAGTAQQSGTAVFANTSGTATYSTTSGTAVFATNSGTATYADTSGTAVFATNASTAVTISGSIAQSQVTNLTTDLAGKANLAGGNAFTGAQTVTGTAIGSIVATVTGASGQTANLQNWTNGGVIQASIGPFGNATLGTTGTVYGRLSVNTGTTGTIGAVIRGVASQTGNLQEWQTSDASIRAFVSPFGLIAHGSPAAIINNSGGGNSRVSISTVSTLDSGLTIRGVASQSANLLELQNSASGLLARVESTGKIVGGQNITALGSIHSFNLITSGTNEAQLGTATLSVGTRAVGNVGAIVRGVSGQTADLLQVQDSAGTNFLNVNSAGSLLFGSGSGSFLSGANGRVNVQLSGDNIGVTVRAFGSQTAMLQSWQNSAGTELGRVRGAGQFGVGSLITGAGLAVNNDLFGASTVPIVIRAAASQTADLLLVQNSASATIARIDSVGDITARVQRSTFAARFTTTDPSIAIQVNTAASGQTGDYLQMQNSGGTVVSRITSSGQSQAVDFRTSNVLGVLREISGGGNLLMSRTTSATSSPGADRVMLYVVTGTNPSTLKLVVRAGATGAETTILDNIPT